ncbi:unnamed protein product [Prorocentrum cordatum]|uniref:Uncharacterized protein n=1 Tax=Prorocentrum cordatum TaxID=2364126 RepID=A0ABN9PY29_9DINO|nr:unnamed protein product [Polarella glacialis]
MLGHLGFVARLLCAALVAPRPCVLLASQHNGGHRLSCNVSWGRYFDLEEFSVLREQGDAEPEGALAIGPQGSVSEQYTAARAAAIGGRPFVWRLKEYYYSKAFQAARDALVQPDLRGCAAWAPRYFRSDLPDLEAVSSWELGWLRYRQPGPSAFVAALRDKFLAGVPLMPGSYNAFHLRKANDDHGCDTSVAKVVAYLACSLQGDASALVVLSEAPAEEVRQIERELSRSTPLRLFVHADPGLAALARDVAAEGPDNFLVYAAGQAVLGLARRQLQRRRRLHCTACDPP